MKPDRIHYPSTRVFSVLFNTLRYESHRLLYCSLSCNGEKRRHFPGSLWPNSALGDYIFKPLVHFCGLLGVFLDEIVFFSYVGF